MPNGERLNPKSPSKIAEEERPRCGARGRTGNPCRNMAGSNTPHPGYGHCSKHGGNTEAGLKAGARAAGRDIIDKFKRDYAMDVRFGGDRKDPSIANLTPESALVEEVRRSAAMVRFLEERIAHWGLDFDEAVLDWLERDPNSHKSFTKPEMAERVRQYLASLDDEDPSSLQHLPELIQIQSKTGLSSYTNKREWLYLYREERAHLARVAKMALDAGVAQRLVSLAEDQGRILSSALRAVLSALSLTPEQQRAVPIIVPIVLRAVASDQPVPPIDQLIAAVEGTTPDQKALTS